MKPRKKRIGRNSNCVRGSIKVHKGKMYKEKREKRNKSPKRKRKIKVQRKKGNRSLKKKGK